MQRTAKEHIVQEIRIAVTAQQIIVVDQLVHVVAILIHVQTDTQQQ